MSKLKQATSRKKLPILTTESSEEFLAVRSRLLEQFKPCGVIEEIYFDEVVTLAWELRRERNARTSLINAAYQDALRKLLRQLLNEDEYTDIFTSSEADELAVGWFGGEGREKVLEVLKRFNLDETAIEAQAIMQASAQIALIDRSIAVKSARLDKSIRFIEDYRTSQRHRGPSRDGKVLENGRAILIDHDSSEAGKVKIGK